MAVVLSPIGGAAAQFFDNSGYPLTGGKIYTYLAGTTTPAPVYTTSAGNVAHSNPIVLDASGRVPSGEIWQPEGTSYKYVIKNSSDVLLGTYDNINPTYVAQDLANTSTYPPGDALVGFRQTNLTGFGAGTYGRTVNNKLQEIVSVLDFIPQSEQAAIQAGTSTYDCLPAFQNAMAYFPSGLDTTYYSYGGTIYVPPGKYYLSGTFKVDRNIKLIGAGSPYGNDEGSSRLEFAKNCDGILLVDYRDSPNNKQGSGMVIQDLSIQPKAGGTTGSGVSMKTTARLVNLYCCGWPEHGIKIDASTSYTPASNANIWYVSGCTTSSNTLHGLYVKGADANAGACYSHNAIGNGGWGIYDSSFLGNTYVGCHTSSNVAGSYKSDNPNARNMFLNCYSEGGQPSAAVVAPAMIIGGLIDAGTSPALLGGLGPSFYYQGGVGADTFYLGYNQAATSGVGMSFSDTQGAFPWTFVKTVGRWGYQWASLGTPGGFQFYDRTATPANGYARDLSSASSPSGSYGAIGVAEHYFGAYSQMKWRGLGSSAPASGTYLQGDIVWNTAPTAGGYVGWVCVSGGSPGTWKGFGAIAA